MSALVKKLFIKPGYRIALVGAPAGAEALLEPLPAGVALEVGADQPPYDIVLGYVRSQKDAAAFGKKAAKWVAPEGALWLAYPKLSAGVETDLSRDVLHGLMGTVGWDGVSLVAVDDTWSAMRFKSTGGGAQPHPRTKALTQKAGAPKQGKTAKPARKRSSKG